MDRAETTSPTWSPRAETDLMMRRMGGDKAAQPAAFWPGRPNLHASECPVSADGELLELQADALEAAHDAIQNIMGARTSSREYVEVTLTQAEGDLLKAVKLVTALRQRIATAVPANFGEID